MIELDSQLCKELDITYWQLKDDKQEPNFLLNHDERELLRKILIAKAVKLDDEMIEILEEGVVIVNLDKHRLLFKDVDKEDEGELINLAKLSEMIKDPHQKKRTWFKLKDLLLV